MHVVACFIVTIRYAHNNPGTLARWWIYLVIIMYIPYMVTLI